MNCGRQLDCENFKWERKAKSHHIRLTEDCLLWDGKCCVEQHDIKQGLACNISKIKRLKGER